MINISNINISEIKFFNPTSKFKELVILQCIESNQDVTQKELAEKVNAAPSMINNYINDYEEKGFLVREYISSKTVKYNITSKGAHRKKFLTISYLHELLKLYDLAKENTEKFIEDLENKGYKKIILYGAGEVAETILTIVKDKQCKNLVVQAIIDDNEDKHSIDLLGHKIISYDEIKNYDHDAIVITSYTYEDDIRMRLEEVGYDRNRVVRFFGE